MEISKTIWGSSTRALENARKEAVTKDYPCSIDACFDAVTRLTQGDKQKDFKNQFQEEGEEPEEEEEAAPENPRIFTPFIIDERRKLIVLMGVPGNIDTTEVGVFFTGLDSQNTKVEISSLSSSAKANAADIIFDALTKEFLPTQ